MLQNSTVTAFTVSKLLRENQLGGVKLLPPNFIVFTESIISLKLNYSEMQKDWPIICFHLWKHILGVT